MVYRPTVRYDDYFRDYVEELFNATHLDRNQIMRAALFFFGCGEGKIFLEQHLKKECNLPSPLYVQYPNHEFFANFIKNLEISVGGRDVTLTSEGGTSGQKIVVKNKGIKLILKEGQQ